MADRVTIKDVRSVVDNLNRRLEHKDSSSRVIVGQRYDYTAIDETDVQGGIRRTLTAGTKREVYEAVYNMIRGIDLYELEC